MFVCVILFAPKVGITTQDIADFSQLCIASLKGMAGFVEMYAGENVYLPTVAYPLGAVMLFQSEKHFLDYRASSEHVHISAELHGRLCERVLISHFTHGLPEIC